MVIALRGNHPPVPTCLVQKIAGRPQGSPLHFSIVATCESFLRPAAHECVLRRVSIPNFHSVSDRCWSPISYFIRSTRVSLLMWVRSSAPRFLYRLSIAADVRNVKAGILHLCKDSPYIPYPISPTLYPCMVNRSTLNRIHDIANR
jgi:hypothetical protein